MKIIPIKRALLSVSDKTNIAECAKLLIEQKIEIISTGGTSRVLQDAKIPHRQIENVTQFPEMMNGRVKTLHPKIHAGILGKRDQHAIEAQQHDVEWIDLLIVNFYPFKETIAKPGITLDEAIESIDIGGPAMVRAAAKNMAYVCVVTDPNDYPELFLHLKKFNGIQQSLSKKFAMKAFALTASYDTMISNYFLNKLNSDDFIADQEINAKQDNLNSLDINSEEFNLTLRKHVELRYGENPHQSANAYIIKSAKKSGILAAQQLQGKPLSYNNILDADVALSAVNEFEDPACVIIKHGNPCGISENDDIDIAFQNAYEGDPLSAFGGIIALNRTCSKKIAERLQNIFIELVIAPGFEEEALHYFSLKSNVRLLISPQTEKTLLEMRFIQGGCLLQEKNHHALSLDDLKIVTAQKPNEHLYPTILFAWKALKHAKSNAILIAKDKSAVGIGAGLQSRIDAVQLAIKKAEKKLENAVLASDAFFPFRDSIDRIAQTGIKTILQPGGSVRDEEVIAACNEHGIAMLLTGKRCFKH